MARCASFYTEQISKSARSISQAFIPQLSVVIRWAGSKRPLVKQSDVSVFAIEKNDSTPQGALSPIVLVMPWYEAGVSKKIAKDKLLYEIFRESKEKSFISC